jgi:hypothetical protein
VLARLVALASAAVAPAFGLPVTVFFALGCAVLLGVTALVHAASLLLSCVGHLVTMAGTAFRTHAAMLATLHTLRATVRVGSCLVARPGALRACRGCVGRSCQSEAYACSETHQPLLRRFHDDPFCMNEWLLRLPPNQHVGQCGQHSF